MAISARKKQSLQPDAMSQNRFNLRQHIGSYSDLMEHERGMYSQGSAKVGTHYPSQSAHTPFPLPPSFVVSSYSNACSVLSVIYLCQTCPSASDAGHVLSHRL